MENNTATAQLRFQYTVPAEDGLCALYAESFDGAYAAIREIHGVLPSYLRVICDQENDWLCPLSPIVPTTGEVADEIRKFGYIRWDGNPTEPWTPRA